MRRSAHRASRNHAVGKLGISNAGSRASCPPHAGCIEVLQVKGPAKAATGIPANQAGSLLQAGPVAGNVSLTKQHDMLWTGTTVKFAG